jgi:hypothetical protein
MPVRNENPATQRLHLDLLFLAFQLRYVPMYLTFELNVSPKQVRPVNGNLTKSSLECLGSSLGPADF